MSHAHIPIFDGHNDALLRLYLEGGLRAAPRFMTGRDGAVDLPKAKAGNFAGGFFAVYVPSPASGMSGLAAMNQPRYDIALPPALDIRLAREIAGTEIDILLYLERHGALKICRTTGDLRDCIATGALAAILHIEGADMIDADLEALDSYYAAGLRSLGPVWSRPNMFGHGVPFRFPSDGDTGPGLTDAGKRLVKRCNELKIMIDLSHLNEAGFWDVARLSDAPLVATHSNAHALCHSSRNLTDRQLAAIAESDGMVGVNFAVAFLRADGQKDEDVSLDIILRHLDYLIGILGEDRVGFGSDYDGAEVPNAITTVADLDALRTAMAGHGYDAALIEKLCYKNWLRVLDNTWA